MKRAVACLAFSLATAGASALPALAQNEPAPDCTTAQACARIVADYRVPPPPGPGEVVTHEDQINPTPFGKAATRLRALGLEGTDAIVPLLDDANPYVRQRAAYVLWNMSAAPRHLPALIKAKQNGERMLEPAIGSTLTDEALAFLWQDFLTITDPQGRNGGLIHGLRHFGARAGPRMDVEMGRCRDGLATPAVCVSLVPLLEQYASLDTTHVRWAAIARSPRAAPAVRAAAADELIRVGHASTIELLIEKVQRLAPDPWAYREAPDSSRDGRSNTDTEVAIAIGKIASYGTAAVGAGPALAQLVPARGLPRTRLAAILALGRIGYTQGAAVLAAQQVDFDDDWELAYNVAESLGRLGVGEPELKAMARDHWYRPVRNNAVRALGFKATGRFELPGGADDPSIRRFLISPNLRHPADWPSKAQSLVCPAVQARDYEQYEARIDWPDRAETGPVMLNPLLPRGRTVAWPLGRDSREQLVLATRLGDYEIVGTDAGEWGGAILSISPGGEVRTLIPENAVAVFPIDGGLLVATGLSHFLSRGDLWIVRLDQAGVPQVQRRIRLPGEPKTFRMVWPRTLIITAAGDDIAVGADGRVSAVDRLAACGGRG